MFYKSSLTLWGHCRVLLPGPEIQIRDFRTLYPRMELPTIVEKKFNMNICFKWHKGKCLTKYMIFSQNQAMKWRKMDTYSEGRNITRCWILSIFRLLHIILARDIRRIALSCSIKLNILKHWLFHKNVQWYGSV